ncbi:ABC transporter permease subunit [Thalassomonas viridans]|uniref:ABC transporter permease subunit n=1 Tax=Thalassomonas viridans TaxID=137584 RepID=A0AAF0CBQ0_9GAMM|nr:ABC transporter permease subunit [Thalassomonas viridans]WDE06794.1 ABC transporter permease subunit [Thalassomonas viridans]
MYRQFSFQRAWSLASFELIRLFFTRRGALALAAFVTVWGFILYYPVSSAAAMVSSESFKGMATSLFGSFGLSELLTWRAPELAIYWLVAVCFFPLFTLYAASDQTCADRSRGTLRFISLRASRTEILLGRFFGQALILFLLMLVTLLAVLAMAVYRDSGVLLDSSLKGLALLKELVIAVLPFIALMSFFNSFIRSARLAIVACLLFYGFMLIFVGIIESWFAPFSVLNYLLPGIQLRGVINQQGADMGLYLIPLGQTLGYLLAGDVIMRRSRL